MRCIHYFTTFDPELPRGCKLYGMRTRQFPNLMVKKETGSDCMGFEVKKRKESEGRDSKQGRDLNDPTLW
jgi:hypothetical protein